MLGNYLLIFVALYESSIVQNLHVPIWASIKITAMNNGLNYIEMIRNINCY